MRNKYRVVSYLVSAALISLFSLNCFADGEAVYVDAPSSTPKAEVLMEASTGQVLFESSAHEKLPVGTLAKLMTVLLVAEEIDSGKLSADEQITVGKNAFSAKGAVIWLNVGEKMSVEDLLKGVIIGNANDASIALAEAVCGTEADFVARMNMRAKELGMSGTLFANCTGLDGGKQYSTAYDTSLLTRELLRHDFLMPYMQTYIDELRNGETQIVNVNPLVRDYEGALGVKSAYTDDSGYCLSAAAERDGITYIAVVLGCSDKDISVSTGKTLLNKGFSEYELRSPAVPTDLMKPLAVRGGIERSVLVYPESLADIVIPNGAAGKITSEVILPEYVEAPVSENQVVGEIKFTLDSKEIYKSDLLASKEVEEMNFFNALCILFKSALTF